jgi:hypothetical protein
VAHVRSITDSKKTGCVFITASPEESYVAGVGNKVLVTAACKKLSREANAPRLLGLIQS